MSVNLKVSEISLPFSRLVEEDREKEAFSFLVSSFADLLKAEICGFFQISFNASKRNLAVIWADGELEMSEGWDASTFTPSGFGDLIPSLQGRKSESPLSIDEKELTGLFIFPYLVAIRRSSPFSQTEKSLMETFLSGFLPLLPSLLQKARQKRVSSAKLKAPSKKDIRQREKKKIHRADKSFRSLMGQKSEAFQKLLNLLEKLTLYVGREVTVYLHGEVGVGKSKIASQIARYSPIDEKKDYFTINCGALSSGTMRLELFGSEKGSFTGAENRAGIFEVANGGIVFLDEIHHLSLSNQKVLLQILSEGTFRRIGGRRNKETNVMVIAASSRDIRTLSRDEFLPELASRLTTICLEVPPLRERMEDLPELTEFLINNLKKDWMKESAQKLVEKHWDHFLSYSWPKNVRELEDTIIQFGFEITDTFLKKTGQGQALEIRPESMEASGLDEFVQTLYQYQVTHFMKDRITTRIRRDYEDTLELSCNKTEMAEELGVDSADRLDTYLKRCQVEWSDIKEKCLETVRREIE